ncbi:MAG: hypothetical protein ACLQCB_09635 [Spirochaetia bacterium]
MTIASGAALPSVSFYVTLDLEVNMTAAVIWQSSDTVACPNLAVFLSW